MDPNASKPERSRGPDPLDPVRGRGPKRRAPNGMFIFLVILFVAILLIGLGQRLTGAGETREVSWGTFVDSYLLSKLDTLSIEQIGEIREGFEELPGIDETTRNRLVQTLTRLPLDDTNLEKQRAVLLLQMRAIPGLSGSAFDAAHEVVREVVDRAQLEERAGRKVKRMLVEGEAITAELKGMHVDPITKKQYTRIRTEIPKELSQSPELEVLLRAAVEKPDNFDYRTPFPLTDLLLGIVPWIFIILIIYFFFFRTMRSAAGPGNVLNFSRSRARLITGEQVKVTFDDVAGVDEAKDEVKELVEFLRHPKKFRRLGGRMPRGILLVGAPGTGKTLLAKAIAGESGVPFYSISGSDFVEMFVGVGAGRVRDLFRQAREQAPCVVFLDEIDAVGRRRGSGLGGGHDEREQTLNQILVEMDGFGTDENVIVMAATNRPDILDPALLRPGRFDREVVLDLPDVIGRQAILQVHIKKIRLREGVDLAVLARSTPGCSGADLAAIINEAAILATMRNHEEVLAEDLEEARDKIMWGRQKKSRVMAEDEKKTTAYHEAGHAIIAELLRPASEPVHKVTIIPRGMSLGSTMRLPDRDRYIMPRSYFNATLAVLFGGRASEEIFCKDISHGARDDIKKATDLARAMVTEYGMSEKMGPVAYGDPQEHLFLGREITRTTQHSEATAQEIDSEVRRLLDEAYDKARSLIEKHREKLERIAQALLRYETLNGDEVGRILQGEDIDALRADAAAQTT